MNRSRKAAKLHSVISHDNNGNVSLPADLTLGAAPSAADNSTRVTTTAWIRSYVGAEFASMVASAPATLDTLSELAAALGNDPNFATTVATSIGTRVPQARTITINGVSFDLSADRSWTIAGGVTSFNTRTGAITLSSNDVTTALGYTPYNSSNPSGYITGYTETDTLASVTGRGATTSSIVTFTSTSSAASVIVRNDGSGEVWRGRVGHFNATADKSVWLASYNGFAVVGAHNNALTAWADLLVNCVDNSGSGGTVRLAASAFVGSNAIIHAGNIGSQSVSYALNSTRLYASNAPYAFGGGSPYYMTMNYDGTRWLLEVTPGTPAAVRVAYADSAGSVDFNNLTNKTGGAGTYQTSGDFRAPIFYDSNNTGYYVDPAGTTSLRTVGAWRSDSGAWDGEFNGKIQYHGNSWYFQAASEWYFRSSVGNNVVTITQGGALTTSGLIRVNANTNLYLDYNYGQSIVGVYTSTRYQGVFAMGDAYKLPIDGTSTGNLYGIAWSHPDAGGVAGNLNTHGALILENGTFLAAISGSIRSRDDMRAPIFYDSNNTGYYVDPNATSVITSLFLNGTITVNSGNAQFWQAANGAYQRVDSRNEGTAARSHWYGVLSDGSTSNFRHSWYDGSAYFDIAATGGFINFTRSGGGAITTDGSFRAPIFYDSNDTGYYVDPNGNSYQNRVDTNQSYTYGWFRNFYSNTGLYNEATTQHWSSQTNGYWDASSTTSITGIRFWTGGHLGAIRGYVYANNGNEIGFLNQSGEWSVRCDGSRNVYALALSLGGATPTGFALNISGNAQIVRSSTSTALIVGLSGVTGSVIRFSYNGGFVGSISTDGSNTAYNTSSDYRLKEDIIPIENPVSKILSLNPVNFKYKNSQTRQDGFIAHELKEVLPYLVFGEKDAVDEEGNPVYQEVDYSKLTPILIAAIKELKTEIETLKTQL